MTVAIQRIERHHIIRERTFTITRPTVAVIAEIVDNLRDEHMTGQVVINLSQGAIQNVQVEERTRIALT